ncbi:MAG: hypothetical protein ACKO37_04540 [Vampirovibrionales bacterium]
MPKTRKAHSIPETFKVIFESSHLKETLSRYHSEEAMLQLLETHLPPSLKPHCAIQTLKTPASCPQALEAVIWVKQGIWGQELQFHHRSLCETFSRVLASVQCRIEAPHWYTRKVIRIQTKVPTRHQHAWHSS